MNTIDLLGGFGLGMLVSACLIILFVLAMDEIVIVKGGEEDEDDDHHGPRGKDWKKSDKEDDFPLD